MMNKVRWMMAVVSASLILLSCRSTAQQTNLSVPDFEKGINQNNIQVLDVRTVREYQSGHLKNAFLADWTNQQEFTERVAALDKTKPVYTYCLSGIRSAAAADWLNKNGYTAYNLAGGINAWRRDNKPLEAVSKETQMSMADYLALIPADETVLVDFSAVWCPPCKKMEPVIAALEKTNSVSFKLLKVDGGIQTELCKALNIVSFPTFIIYKNGKPVWRREGVVEQKDLEEALR